MDVRDTVMDWLVSPETAYLIGAGCSSCAGKPLIGKLTTDVVAALDAPVQQRFQLLQGSAGRDATVEDLLNHLLKLREISSSMTKEYNDQLSLNEIECAVNGIRHKIVDQIKDNWIPSEQHQDFLRRLRPVDKSCRDLFTINYDTVIEASFEALRLSYIDGFRGAENAHFDSSFSLDTGEAEFRLFKLHGSINWARDDEDHVRRRPLNAMEALDAIVVYPCEQKYIQTQYGVYETLMALF